MISVPALFAMGADDGCFHPDVEGASLAYCTTVGRVEILEGCGHFLHVEAPERVNELVLSALRAGGTLSSRTPAR